MEYTRGPWKVERRTVHGVFGHTTHIVSMNGGHIAEVSPNDIEACAKLIAAAPDLFNALQELYALVESIKPELELSGPMLNSFKALQKAII